jgi:hypothetical protein
VQDEEPGPVAMLQDFIGKAISLQVERDDMREQTDVVPM